MIRRLITQAALVVAPSAVPLEPAQAEFFSYAQMQGLCRGDTGDGAAFRTDASRRLLAETYRARCRMYLLGQADAQLQRIERLACIPAGTPESEVGDTLAQGLLDRAEAPPGGVGEVVRDVLRARYGCTSRF